MLPSFTFATSTQIIFGRGSAAEAARRSAAFGDRVLLVHGADAARADWLCLALEREGCRVSRLAVPREPDLQLIEAARDGAAGTTVVVALGGGAAIDAGKAVAALLPAQRPVLDHLEVIGRGLPLDHPPLPFVAIPTTAGTGAEVTRNAVIGVPAHGRKVSLRDARMLPRLAIVDPALTDACPRGVTLASGLDAITQVIEPYVSTRANPMTDALCRDAIPRGLKALMRLMEAEDMTARDEMAWTSLCGGLALANSGLGAVHGLAGPLGGLTGAAHGAICGALLPHVLVANRAAVADAALARRLDEVGGWIHDAFGTSGTLDQAAGQLSAWSRQAGLPGLAVQGVDPAAMAEAAGMAAGSSSMKSNPAQLSEAVLRHVLAEAA